MTSEELILAMTERIVGMFHPLRVILFGSCARGEVTRDSDIDLLVELPTVGNKREQAIAIRRALADFPIGKDIVVTTPEEIALRGHVVGTILRPALREGRILYDSACYRERQTA